MKIIFHENFEKQYKKLSRAQKVKFKIRLAIFIKYQFHPTLNNHALMGKYMGYRSINISGNTRAIYKAVKQDTAIFVFIGTHIKLYS